MNAAAPLCSLGGGVRHRFPAASPIPVIMAPADQLGAASCVTVREDLLASCEYHLSTSNFKIYLSMPQSYICTISHAHTQTPILTEQSQFHTPSKLPGLTYDVVAINTLPLVQKENSTILVIIIITTLTTESGKDDKV